MLSTLFTSLSLALCAVCAATDARSGRIPNAVTLPALGGGLALHAATGAASLSAAVLGVLAAGGLPWLFHRATRGQAIGGGDVKLFAALGALLGPVTALEVELSSFLMLGAFALVRLAFAGRLLGVLASAAFLLANPFLPPRHRRTLTPEAFVEMRLGPAILCAIVTVTAADRIFAVFPWLG